MKRGLAGLLFAAAVVLPGGSAIAHHSFAAQYDRDKPVTLAGVVTRIEWMNPHVYFYMDVKDAAGGPVHWAVESGAPNTLYRAGWRKDSIKIGDQITVEGYLARDGSKLANMRTATLADGRLVLTNQQDRGPETKRPGQ
jgi:hypothetical protein